MTTLGEHAQREVRRSTAATLLALYEQMMLIRRFELTAQDVYRKGEMPGFIHLYVGEEATAVGVCAHLRARRLDHQHAPRPRPRAGQGRAAGRSAGRAVRQSRRLLRRTGRQHAPVQARRRTVRHQRLRRRRIAGHGRAGTQRPHARHRPGGRGVLRRRRGQSRRVSRIAELRRRAKAAGRLRLRKQSVRHGHAARHGHAQHRSRQQGRRLRNSRRRGRRQRRAGRVGSRARRPSSGPARAAARR